ncbi:hypothetical protein D3C76_1213990 [compost metagenome]
MADFAPALRLADRLRSRSMRSRYQSSSSPVRLQVLVSEEASASAARRPRMAGSAVSMALVVRLGKSPALPHLPLTTTCQAPRVRSTVE